MSSHGVVFVDSLEGRLCLSAPTRFESAGPGGGGAFFAPSFSPFNPAELFASSDMSGLYHSASTGASWKLTDFRQIQASRGSIVGFTADPNILFTLDYNESHPVAPTRSADGGQTWSLVSGWEPLGADAAYSLYADPASTGRILVSSYTTLYLSTDGGQSFAAKYTDAGGLYCGGAFFDGANVYVGTSDGLLVSSNGGASFAVSGAGGLPAGSAIVSLSGARQNSTTRLWVALAGAADVYPGLPAEELGSSYSGIYSLDVGQASWVARVGGVPAGQYPHFVGSSRGNIDIVYAAGSSDAGAPVVLKSVNGGSNWSPSLLTAGNQNVGTGWQGAGGDRGWGYGELVMGFAVSPADANTLAFTDFGFIHLSTDGGANWRQAYLNPADQNPANSNTPQHKAYRGIGLEDTSALWLIWTDPATLVAGYTDIYGARSADGGLSWAIPTNLSLVQNTLYHVSSLASASVPSGVILYGAGSSVHDLYQSTYLTDSRIDGGAGKIIYSTDKGATWATLHDFGHPVIYTAIDPTNTNRMYASVVHSTQGGIFVTNNLNLGATSTWAKVNNPPRTEGHPFNVIVLNDGTLVATYSARRTAAGAFTASSGVFISSNGGTNWTDRSLIGTPGSATGMEYWTKDLTIDPTDPNQNTWYIAVRSGWGGAANNKGGLYRTTNRGVNWTRIFSGASVESATVHPTSGELYFSTLDAGLWYCASPGAASPVFTQVNYPFRQPERIFINPHDTSQIWVSSFGYGLARSVAADTTAPAVTVSGFDYAAPSQRIWFTFSEDVSLSVTRSDLTVRNLATNQVMDPALFAYSYDLAGNTARFTYAGQLPDGRYRATLAGGAVVDGAGNPMSADASFDFFTLIGDADRNGAVNFFDLTALAAAYGQPNMTWAEGDFNGDGAVNFFDLTALAANYSVTLPAPSEPLVDDPLAASALALVTTAPEAAPAPLRSPTAIADRPVVAPRRMNAAASDPPRPKSVPNHGRVDASGSGSAASPPSPFRSVMHKRLPRKGIFANSAHRASLWE